MTFDQLPPTNNDGLLHRGDKQYLCGNCKNKTHWIDFGWGVGVPTCGPECQAILWEGYFEALNAPALVTQEDTLFAPFIAEYRNDEEKH